MSKTAALLSLLRRLLLASVAVVPLYLLSGGPAIVFMVRSTSPSVQSAIHTFYTPLRWIDDETPLGEALGLYQTWCFKMENKCEGWLEKNETEPPPSQP